jgi:hypothetical protein
MHAMTSTVVYIFPLCSPEYHDYALRFLESYHAFPPRMVHETVVVLNGGKATAEIRCLFSSLPNLRFLVRDNSGKDIGGFIAAAKTLTADLMVCFGSHGYFWREGWLRRMVEAREKHGPGLYGSSASYEVLPHLNTVGFWVDPPLLASYPWPVITDDDRYNFENQRTQDNRQFWKLVYRQGKPVLLVTWDGEYQWWDWRTPPEIFRRGGQTAMLAWWKQTDVWRDCSPQEKARFRVDTDILRDRRFNLRQRTFS